MERWGFRVNRLSPLQSALVTLGVCVLAGGALLSVSPLSEMREGAGIFFVFLALGFAALAYWHRQREDAGLPKPLSKLTPLIASIALFVSITLLMAVFSYFTDPDKIPLLYGALMGAWVGLLNYQFRRGVKPTFLRFFVTYIPLFIVYLAVSAYLGSPQ